MAPAEYVADEHVAETSSHAVTVHLQQQSEGIPIFQATQVVRFAPDGSLSKTAGSSVPVTGDIEAMPTLPVREAVVRAAQHVAVPDADEEGGVDEFGEPLDLPRLDLTGFEPKAIASFSNQPDLPAVFERGPFGGSITASLVWFPLGDALRLGWEINLAMPGYAGEYRTIVDAKDGEILYCRQLVQTVAARGNVLIRDGDGPREMTSFPRQLADYDVPVSQPLPPGFPDDWVESDSTAGNSVIAHLDTSGPALRGNRNGQLTFDPADPESDEQNILNLFYVSCFLHDYFYLLGFREADGELPARQPRPGWPGDRPGRGAGSPRSGLRDGQHVYAGRGLGSRHEHGAGDEYEQTHRARCHGRDPRVHARREQSPRRGGHERPGPGRSSEPRLRGGLQRLLRLHDHRKHGRRVMGGTSARRPARICIRLELPR